MTELERIETVMSQPERIQTQQLVKQRTALYRKAAATRVGVFIDERANVQHTPTGAFVDAQVWVPIEEIEIEEIEKSINDQSVK